MLVLGFLKMFAIAVMINSILIGFFLWLKNKGLEDVQIMIVVAVLTFLQCLFQVSFLLNR